MSLFVCVFRMLMSAPHSRRMRGNLPKHNDINDTHFASNDILDSLMPFEDNSSNHLQFQQQHQQENPFKYSKEFMLGLFKPALHLPSDFKQHEYVTTEGCNAPLAFEELTEAEKKVQLQRRIKRHHPFSLTSSRLSLASFRPCSLGSVFSQEPETSRG